MYFFLAEKWSKMYLKEQNRECVSKSNAHFVMQFWYPMKQAWIFIVLEFHIDKITIIYYFYTINVIFILSLLNAMSIMVSLDHSTSTQD